MLTHSTVKYRCVLPFKQPLNLIKLFNYFFFHLLFQFLILMYIKFFKTNLILSRLQCEQIMLLLQKKKFSFKVISRVPHSNTNPNPRIIQVYMCCVSVFEFPSQAYKGFLITSAITMCNMSLARISLFIFIVHILICMYHF